MNAVTTLTIGTDGTARGLYTDALDLRQLGKLSMARASVVEFKHTTQQWEVRTPDGKIVLYSHESREECLRWEREFFTR